MLGAITGCIQPIAQSGAAPSWRSYEEAASASVQNGKKVLVEVYAPWCGWCRRLERHVLSDPGVRQYLEKHFESTRLDGDSGDERYRVGGETLTGIDLARRLGAVSFPTTVLLEPGGEDVIIRLPGYVDRDAYLTVLRYVATDAYRSMSFEAFIQSSRATGR